MKKYQLFKDRPSKDDPKWMREAYIACRNATDDEYIPIGPMLYAEMKFPIRK